MKKVANYIYTRRSIDTVYPCIGNKSINAYRRYINEAFNFIDDSIISANGNKIYHG